MCPAAGAAKAPGVGRPTCPTAAGAANAPGAGMPTGPTAAGAATAPTTPGVATWCPITSACC